jgi:histidine triad (HIT) family protein
MDCLFCKIVAKEIPNHTVYEDNAVLAFLDIFPRSEGHTVVIPKNHGETIFDFTSDELGTLMNGVQKTAQKVQEILKPDGFTIGLNHGEVAGQAVPHLHFHILPRWKSDGGGNIHSIVKQENMRTVGEVAKLFKH